MRPRFRLATLTGVVALGALLATAFPAAAADRVPDLVKDFEALLGQRDDKGYAAQRDVLDRMAEVRSEESRDALRGLLKRYGDADRRRATLILGAWLRYGSAKDVDTAILWVESRKDPLLIDLLHRVLGEPRLPSTRAHVRGPALRGATPRVKAQIVRALGTSKDPEALAPLLALVREENLLVRVETLEALGRLGEKKALPVIQVFLRNQKASLRAAAARALGLLGEPLAFSALERALSDPAPIVVESVAGAFGALDDPRAIPLLIAGLERVHRKNLRLEDAFAQALQAISGKAIHPDPELWRSWWATMKDKPFEKATEKPGSRTVPGPSYYGFPVRSSRVVFVLDVSRSMGWNRRLDSAKKELLQVLENLPRPTYFNLIVFSDRAYAWKPSLTEAKPALVKRALAFVRAQRALNGTNTYGALARAFREAHADTIFLLSDGHPSVGRVVDPDLILTRVREWNRHRRVRIHGVALLRGEPPAAYQSLEDPARSLSFMQRLTKQNDGRFKTIR